MSQHLVAFVDPSFVHIEVGKIFACSKNIYKRFKFKSYNFSWFVKKSTTLQITNVQTTILKDMVSLLVMVLKKNKLQIWQHVHIFVHKEMIVVHLSILALKKCANFILSVFQTALHLEIIDFARNVSTTYLTVGVT